MYHCLLWFMSKAANVTLLGQHRQLIKSLQVNILIGEWHGRVNRYSSFAMQKPTANQRL